MRVLGIESSCDDCSVAVLSFEQGWSGKPDILSMCSHSQVALHHPYGGIVPEVASRDHLDQIFPVLQAALDQAGVKLSDIDLIAVTNRPGLVGSLLIGVTLAKSLHILHKIPVIPVHHLEGHLISPYLSNQDIPLPSVTLLVSGGHTELHLVKAAPHEWPSDFFSTSRLGRSRDDAAGEAFDKTAKQLGLPYPGGLYLDREAKLGDPAAFAFPRALGAKDTLDFSFSGLKTAVSDTITKMGPAAVQERFADLSASIQEAIVDALLRKTKLALEQTQAQSLCIVGGVAANSRLRARMRDELTVPVFTPEPVYCTDNAAMIALAGAARYFQFGALKPEAVFALNAHSAAKQ